MGFLTGRAGFLRFAVDGPPRRGFDEDTLKLLEANAAGQSRVAAADGVEVGWAGGSHVLDTAFSLEKNVLADALVLDLRVDTDKLPGDRLKAYYETELKALAAHNPSGLPSMRQKREARETARNRLEDEAKDGRYRRHKCVPVLWDAASNEVLFGAASPVLIDRLAALFQKTFGYGLNVMMAGKRAEALANRAGRSLADDTTVPAAFVPGVTPDEYAWVADNTTRDFLGDEFLLHLWHLADNGSDTVVTPAGEIAFMFARTLTLDDPRGTSGTDTFKHEGPARMPEAIRAARGGKLPRKVGLTLVRHDQQYEFTFQAETFFVSGLKLPAVDGVGLDANGKRLARLEQLRHAVETLDTLYAAFLSVRLTSAWRAELGRIQGWLSGG